MVSKFLSDERRAQARPRTWSLPGKCAFCSRMHPRSALLSGLASVVRFAPIPQTLNPKAPLPLPTEYPRTHSTLDPHHTPTPQALQPNAQSVFRTLTHVRLCAGPLSTLLFVLMLLTLSVKYIKPKRRVDRRKKNLVKPKRRVDRCC